METPHRKISPWNRGWIDWRPLIEKLKPNVKFNPPATPDQILSAQLQLGLEFPVDLVNLLLESNGIEDWLLSAEKIVETNLHYWNERYLKESYMSLNNLLFFIEDGTGSYYAYPIIDGRCDVFPRIFYWWHETDSREMWAQTLEELLEIRILK